MSQFDDNYAYNEGDEFNVDTHNSGGGSGGSFLNTFLKVAASAACMGVAAAAGTSAYRKIRPSAAAEAAAEEELTILREKVRAAKAAADTAEAEAGLVMRECAAKTDARIDSIVESNVQVQQANATMARLNAAEAKANSEASALVSKMLAGDGAAALEAQQTATADA